MTMTYELGSSMRNELVSRFTNDWGFLESPERTHMDFERIQGTIARMKALYEDRNLVWVTGHKKRFYVHSISINHLIAIKAKMNREIVDTDPNNAIRRVWIELISKELIRRTQTGTTGTTKPKTESNMVVTVKIVDPFTEDKHITIELRGVKSIRTSEDGFTMKYNTCEICNFGEQVLKSGLIDHKIDIDLQKRIYSFKNKYASFQVE